MENQFFFQVETQTYYGIGYSRRIGDLLKEKGLKDVAVLVDEGVAGKSAYFNRIIKIIKDSSNSFSQEIIRGSQEPDYQYLDSVAEKIRKIKKLDVLIGIGGGSCLDITKACAVLRTNKGKGIEYRGFDKVKKPGLPTVAIPSTAGTGSEVTINAVFIDKIEKRKLGINGRYMNATYAILDAEWTLSCPTFSAVSSGMDALTHAIESFICKKANRLTRAFSKQAFKLLYSALPSLVENPKDKERRQELLLGSYLAGIALFNSGSGIASALSYPLGVHFGIPHGMGGGVFLASEIEYNIERGYSEYAELLDALEDHPGFSEGDKNKRFLKIIKDLTKKLGVPKYLNQWGITSENIGEVADLMHSMQAAFDQNPLPFSAKKDVLGLLKKHVAASRIKE